MVTARYKCKICRDAGSSDESESELSYPSDITSESDVSDSDDHQQWEDDDDLPDDEENTFEEDDDDDDDNEIEATTPLPARVKRAVLSQRLKMTPKSLKGHKGRRGPRRTYIKLATGKKMAITVPKVKGPWKCGWKSKLVTLHPRGRMGRREYTIVAKEMTKTLRQHIRCAQGGGCFTKYRIVKLQKILNNCLWTRYKRRREDVRREAGFANERLLFHGSIHVGDISGSGFDERHANLDGMFGAGLYFAKHSSKANQYAFGYMGGKGCPKHGDKGCFVCHRQILLCRVILGRQKRYLTEHKLAHPPLGCHSVLGVPSRRGLWFPEYIVYRGEQIYPEYLITYKIAK